MYKIRIHKALLTNSQESSISVDIKKVSDLLSFINIFYPNIDKTKVLLLNQNYNKFPDSWIAKDEIPESEKICYVVPLISGNVEAAIAAIGQYALQAVAITAFNLALSAVISLIMPRPKNNSNTGVSDQDRNNNDAFDGIINTVDSSNSIPLNYGMLRVGGQIISADVNTINHGKGEQIKVVDYV